MNEDREFGLVNRDLLAQAYDPDAFKEHAIEARNRVAAIQWAARRHVALEAADRLIASDVFARIVQAQKLVADRQAVLVEILRAMLANGPTLKSGEVAERFTDAVMGVVEDKVTVQAETWDEGHKQGGPMGDSPRVTNPYRAAVIIKGGPSAH